MQCGKGSFQFLGKIVKENILKNFKEKEENNKGAYKQKEREKQQK